MCSVTGTSCEIMSPMMRCTMKRPIERAEDLTWSPKWRRHASLGVCLNPERAAADGRRRLALMDGVALTSVSRVENPVTSGRCRRGHQYARTCCALPEHQYSPGLSLKTVRTSMSLAALRQVDREPAAQAPGLNKQKPSRRFD